MPSCYAVGAEKALIQAALRARFSRGKGFIPKPSKSLFYCVTNPQQRSDEANSSPLGDNAAEPQERKRKEAAAQSAFKIYEEIIKDNIEYDILKQDMPYDYDRLDEIVDLMLETVCTRRKTIRIAGDDYPAELVKAKFMKLDSEHIRFVLDCMRENTTKIRNIKQYLRAALFNAPSTIGNYYTSLVAHDMASGALAPRKPKFGDPDYYSCNEGESL